MNENRRGRRRPFRRNNFQQRAPQSDSDTNFTQQRNFNYRSFCQGQEVDPNTFQSRSLYDQRIYASRSNRGYKKMSNVNNNYRRQRSSEDYMHRNRDGPESHVDHESQPAGQRRSTNYSNNNVYRTNSGADINGKEVTLPCEASNTSSNQFDYHESLGNSSSGSLQNTDRNCSNAPHRLTDNESSFSSETRSNDSMSILEITADYDSKLRSMKPHELILEYRVHIENLVEKSIKRNLLAIEGLSQNNEDGIFEAHLSSLHLQREELENYVTKAKKKLNSLAKYQDIHYIVQLAGVIFQDMKSECKLFDRLLPAYSLKSKILSEIENNQVVIIVTESPYYLNVALPIFLRKSLKEKCLSHLFFSCETYDVLRTSLENNVAHLLSEEINSQNTIASGIKFVTINEMLDYIISDNPITKGENEFISICNLSMKRSLIADVLLASLRDLLEYKTASKLILLLKPQDRTDIYESYFSDLEVEVIFAPALSFPVTAVWKSAPLLPADDYIEDVVQTVTSIHTLKGEGDIMAFLPSLADAKSALVNLVKKLPEMCISDIDCVLLHSESPHKEWLDMSFKKKLNKRTVFFVTECAELFVIPTIRYVIDCGLKKENIYDKSKKLDVLTTTFISCDKAKLRKKLAGSFNEGGVCYRLYSKDNFCKEMHAHEYSEILTTNPFNVIIKLFQYQPVNAVSLEFVENLPDSTKSSALSQLKKSNAIKDSKLTALGERIVKLPFPPMYSKFILLGIEWELAYESIILVAFMSVKGRVFQFFDDSELQKRTDAVKVQLVQFNSDTLSYLYIYKLWLENNKSASWCKQHFINDETLKLVHVKVIEICQTIGNILKTNVETEFSDVPDTSTYLIELLFECFQEYLCVFTGHYKSGYRMLASRCISFLHPSSMICQTEDMPEFIIFDHIVSTTREFLVHVTTIPKDMVMKAVIQQSLSFDYSDMFEKSLVQRVIEPVGERLIKQVFLGRKGHKLKEIEHEIKKTFSSESVVIEPSAERGRIVVFALEDCIAGVVQAVKDIIDEELKRCLNLRKTYTLELKKGQITIPIELKWLKGAKVESMQIGHQDLLALDNNLESGGKAEDVPYVVKKSIHLTWTRRKCNGKAIVKFSSACFTLARRLAMRYITIMGAEVFVKSSDDVKEKLLILTGIPADAKLNYVKNDLNNCMPNGVSFEHVELKYEPAFETSKNQLNEIKEIIEDECAKYTGLIDFNVVVDMPKPTATQMKAYINISDDEPIGSAAETISKNLKSFLHLVSRPVYSSVIKCSLKICTALESQFKEKLNELEHVVLDQFPELKKPFIFNIILVEESMPSIKMSSNKFEVLQVLQRTIYNLLEGDVLDHSFNKDLRKMFCHGGSLWLRTLEETSGVHIIDEYQIKSIRLYGSKEQCYDVKKRIQQFLIDSENEAVTKISLIVEGNNRILLKTLLIKYGVNLEDFIKLCGLRSAVLDIKNCLVTVHGSRESIEKAKDVRDELLDSIDLSSSSNLLEDQEKCPVCTSVALNLTYRLEICGHLYCCECIEGLVDQGKFPIQCCFEDCNQDIILDDICKVLGEDPLKINSLLEKSMKTYIEEHKTEIYYCPIPDCSMFFYRDDIPEIKHHCPLCRNFICTKCNVVYHQGLSCEIYQGSKHDPDYSFKIWQQNTEECKQCPKCKTAIQRDGGCDHMACSSCKSHFCWVCVDAFPTERAVYEHIPFCKKYPKW